MAVTVVQGQNPYRTAGSLLALGGSLIPGAGLLTPLGLGMSAAGGGGLGTISSDSVLGGIMNDILRNGWKNPASGNLGTVLPLSAEEIGRIGRYN